MDFAHFLGSALRILVALVCALCFVGLLLRAKRFRHRWNVKTKDYWYATVMWSLSGFVLALQGLFEGRLITPAIVFATAAALATGKALRRPGAWGSDK